MKVATILARVLLGLIFVVFGANFWLRFIPLPPPSGDAAAFVGLLYASGYLALVKVLEIVGGLLVWSGRFTALGLVLLVPIIVNILCYDVFLLKGFNPISTAAAILAVFLLWTERKKFLPLVA
ncbi:MAG: hypothetical protein SFU53_15050 [Terrimicrobiaceae bacterium]|nr:hypothetical protein [Terrimicrobiaceae bacterium]